MRRATAIELCALTLTAAALLALGPISPLASVVAGIAAIVGPRLLRRARSSERWGGAMVLIVLLAGGAILVGQPVAPTVGTAIAAMLGVQRIGRSAPRHDRALLPLAVLALALAAVVSPGPLTALMIVATAATAPVLGVLTTTADGGGAKARVVPRHLVPIALTGVVLCVGCFIVLPRPGSATLGLAPDPDRARIGFADEVAIGDLGELLDDGSPVLRFAIGGDLPPPHLIRGAALDAFDGRRWRSTAQARPLPRERPADAVPVLVHHDAAAGPVAFGPGYLAAVEAERARFEPDEAQTWRLIGPPRSLRYTVWIDRNPPPMSQAERARWLQVPAVDERIAALAAEAIADAADGPAAAHNIAAWLARETTHTLAPRATALQAPLETFLLDRRTGHCEYHATAAAVMLRLGGFPSRVVHGYANPEYDGHTWIVRRGNAHAWVEVLDPEGRWQAVDVTPGGPRPPPAPVALMSWAESLARTFEDHLLSYDGDNQRRAVLAAATRVGEGLPGPLSTPALGLALLALTSVGVIIAAGLAIARVTRDLAGEATGPPEGPVARAHKSARRLVHRAGYRVPPALPPASAAAWLTERDPEAGEALHALAWLHYRVRYAGESDGALLPEAHEALRALRRRLRANPPGATRPRRAASHGHAT